MEPIFLEFLKLIIMDNNIIDERSKGKYKIDKSGNNLFIDCNDYQICEIGYDTDVNKANAAFICKAVNNYDAMIAELKRLYEKYGSTTTAMIIQKSETN